MILLTLCGLVLYVIISGFGLIAIVIFCLLIYLIDYIFKKLNSNEKKESKVERVETYGKYKIVDLSDNKKVLYSYDYQADARKKLRELREQKRNVMISLK